MNQLVNNPQIGDKILRLNSNDRWVETEINETYMELIKEDPRSFRKSVEGKRKGTQFGAHEFTVEYHGPLTVYTFKIPLTRMNSIQIIIGFGITSITGDFGNWIFDRELHPGPKNHVSDHYWLEKLKMTSSQDPYEFDEEATRKEIESWLDGTHGYFDPEDPLTEEEREYLEACSDNCNGKFEYERVAHYDNCGRFDDHEWVPMVMSVQTWLQIIFDGIDVMCDLLKQQEEDSKSHVGDWILTFRRAEGLYVDTIKLRDYNINYEQAQEKIHTWITEKTQVISLLPLINRL